MKRHAPIGASLRGCPAFLCVLIPFAVAGASGSPAADEPLRGPATESPQLYEPILSPAAPGEWLPFATVGGLLLQAMAPAVPGEKGGSFTNAGAGLAPQPPNLLEQRKLDMARAAIEASRAAGTLTPAPSPADLPVAPAPHLFAAQATALRPGEDMRKLDALRGAPFAPLLPDPAACLGVLPAPLQVPGPVGLTPMERAKLDIGRSSDSPRHEEGKGVK